MITTLTPGVRRAATWTAAAALAFSPVALTTTTHAAPAKAGAYTVSAKINKTIAIGEETTLKVRGRVTPKAAGEKVILQQRVLPKRTWKATGTAKIKSTGTYVLKDVPSTPGKREYRVVKPASNGLAKGISKALTVQVYAWQKLGYLPSGPRTNLSVAGVYVATDYYDGSLVTSTPGVPSSVEYTLGRKCLQLRATYALTDSSASGSSGAVWVSTDGTARESHPLAVGTVVADHVLDISNAFRLKFDMTTSASPAAVAAVATPEVLCTR